MKKYLFVFLISFIAISCSDDSENPDFFEMIGDYQTFRIEKESDTRLRIVFNNGNTIFISSIKKYPEGYYFGIKLENYNDSQGNKVTVEGRDSYTYDGLKYDGVYVKKQEEVQFGYKVSVSGQTIDRTAFGAKIN